MEENGLNTMLLQLGIILFWALTLGTVFERLGLPSVLGYTLAGVTLGGSGLNVHSSPVVKVLADLGMVLLLFYIGLEFSIKRLVKTGPQALFISPIKSGLGFLLGYLAAKVLGFPHIAAIVVGAAVAVSSTGIISNTILERRLQHTVEAQLALSTLILEDIVSVLFIAFLLSGMANIGQVLLNSLLVLLLILTVGIYLSRWFFRIIKAFGHEDKVALYALGLLVLFSYGVSLFGISPALGAFFAGVALSEVAGVPRIERDLDMLKKLLVLLFFTSIGLSYTPVITLKAILLALLLTSIQFLSVAMAAVLSPLVGIPPRSAARFLALDLPIGEFSLFFTATAARLGIPGATEILGAVFITIFLTTIASKLLLDRWESIASRFLRFLPLRGRFSSVLFIHERTKDYERRVEMSLTSILLNLSTLFALAYFADYSLKHLSIDLHYITIGVLVLAVYPIYNIVLQLLNLFRYHVESFITVLNPSMDALERKVLSKKASIAALGFVLFITAIFINVLAQLFGTFGLKLLALLFVAAGILSLVYGTVNVLSFLVMR